MVFKRFDMNYRYHFLHGIFNWYKRCLIFLPITLQNFLISCRIGIHRDIIYFNNIFLSKHSSAQTIHIQNKHCDPCKFINMIA